MPSTGLYRWAAWTSPSVPERPRGVSAPGAWRSSRHKDCVLRLQFAILRLFDGCFVCCMLCIRTCMYVRVSMHAGSAQCKLCTCMYARARARGIACQCLVYFPVHAGTLVAYVPCCSCVVRCAACMPSCGACAVDVARCVHTFAFFSYYTMEFVERYVSNAQFTCHCVFYVSVWLYICVSIYIDNYCRSVNAYSYVGMDI